MRDSLFQGDSRTPCHAAHMAGVSRQTSWKWLRRFETEGEAALADRTRAGWTTSSAPYGDRGDQQE